MRVLVQAFVGLFSLLVFAVTPSAGAKFSKPPNKPPLVAPAFNWSGFYGGVHAGYGFSDSDVSIGISDPTTVAQTAAAAGAFPVSYSIDRDGYVAGIQAGYNWQFGSWVSGWEADFSATGINGSTTVELPRCPICGLPNRSSVSQDMNWFGTVRARLGYARDNWLFYGTGGLAYGRVSYSYAQTNRPFGGAVNVFGQDSGVEVGWTAGAGVEYGFGPWSAKLEYLYYDLGDHTFTVAHNLVPAIVQFHPNFTNDGHIIRAGLNRKLDWFVWR
jgi:outer membrane immunogenic protein